MTCYRCPLKMSVGAVWFTDRVARQGVRLTGGVGKSTYFLTVFLEIPSCLAMPLRGTLCSLECCADFRRTRLRGVASLGGGVLAVGSFSSSTGWSAGVSKVARR